MTKTFNHSGSSLNHGHGEEGDVQEDDDKDHDPVLDSVAPPDMTLPERDLLVD